MRFFLLLFSLVLGMISCGKRASDTSREMARITLRIDLDAISEPELKISNFVDSIQFIRLETTNQCIVGQISKLFFLDSIIMAVDSKAGTLLFFDNRGKYLHTFDKRGKGPGEYTRITCALYDSVRQQIVIFDGSMRKMLFYWPDGTLAREIRDFSDRAVIRDLINLPDGSFLCYTPDIVVGQNGDEDRHVGLWKVDSNGRFVQNFLQYHTVYPVSFNRYSSYLTHLTESKIGLTDGVTGDIYHFEQDSLYKHIAYDIVGPKITDFPGKQSGPGAEFSYVSQMFAEQKGSYIYSFWSDGNNIYPVLYSDRDERLTVADVPDRQYVIGHNVPNNRNEIMTSVVTGADILMQQSIKSYPEEVKQVIRQQVQGMTDDQIAEMNPLLEIWHIKP